MEDHEKQRLIDISNGLHHNMQQLKLAKSAGIYPAYIVPEGCKCPE